MTDARVRRPPPPPLQLSRPIASSTPPPPPPPHPRESDPTPPPPNETTPQRSPDDFIFGTKAKYLVSRCSFRWNETHRKVFHEYVDKNRHLPKIDNGDLSPLLRKLDLDGYENIVTVNGETVESLILVKVCWKLKDMRRRNIPSSTPPPVSVAQPPNDGGVTGVVATATDSSRASRSAHGTPRPVVEERMRMRMNRRETSIKPEGSPIERPGPRPPGPPGSLSAEWSEGWPPIKKELSTEETETNRYYYEEDYNWDLNSTYTPSATAPRESIPRQQQQQDMRNPSTQRGAAAPTPTAPRSTTPLYPPPMQRLSNNTISDEALKEQMYNWALEGLQVEWEGYARVIGVQRALMLQQLLGDMIQSLEDDLIL